MRLIKNDPNYNECWPRAVVPYERIYGIEEPKRPAARWPTTASSSKHLPEGTPFGLVGTSSFYKRESYPNGGVPEGQGDGDLRRRQRPVEGARPVHQPRQRHAAQLAQPGRPTPGCTPTTTSTPSASWRWSRRPTATRRRQPAAASTTTPASGCASSARSRCASSTSDGKQPTRPRRQPRHELPGEDPRRLAVHVPDARQARHGAEHGPDLAPAPARRDPQRLRRLPRPQPEADRLQADRRRASPTTRSGTWSNTTPLVTDEGATTSRSRSGTPKDETGLRFAKGGPMNVEYCRDIKPILDAQLRRLPHGQGRQGAGRQPRPRRRRRAGAASSTTASSPAPTTAWRWTSGRSSATSRSATTSWGYPNASRYIRKFQSRRSLLVWKIFGERLDGFSQRRPPVRDGARHAASWLPQGKEVDVPKNTATRRPRLHRQRNAAAGRGQGGQGQAAHRRGPPHDRPLDRPGLPDRPRLRPEAARSSAATAGCSTTSGRR